MDVILPELREFVDARRKCRPDQVVRIACVAAAGGLEALRAGLADPGVELLPVPLAPAMLAMPVQALVVDPAQARETDASQDLLHLAEQLPHARLFPGELVLRRGHDDLVLDWCPRRERTRLTRWPDRVRLPFHFDAGLLLAALPDLADPAWVAHFVRQHYTGSWSALPLRLPAGSEHQHPVLQVAVHPGVDHYVDGPALAARPVLNELLATLGMRVGAMRLMRLEPGSVILPHQDPGLDARQGAARLHVPIRTHADVEFLLNGEPVFMAPGECWYLRLSDTHEVRNRSDCTRIHLVLDVTADARLTGLIACPLQQQESQSS